MQYAVLGGAGGFVLSKKWEEFAPWSSSKDPYAQASGPTWVDFKPSHYYVHARLKKRGELLLYDIAPKGHKASYPPHLDDQPRWGKCMESTGVVYSTYHSAGTHHPREWM